METLLLNGARDSVGLHGSALGQCDFVTVQVDVCASWGCAWTLCTIAFVRFWIRMQSPQINLHLSMYITKYFTSFLVGLVNASASSVNYSLGPPG